jgi:hypothetical protein
MDRTVQSKKRPDQPANEASTSSKPDQKLKNGCLAKMVENPSYEVTSPLVGDYIQYMKDHAVIGKFVGIWHSKNALLVWIKSKWKVTGDKRLKLGSKGFLQQYSPARRTEIESLMKARISLTPQSSTSGTGRSVFPQKRRTSQPH